MHVQLPYTINKKANAQGRITHKNKSLANKELKITIAEWEEHKENDTDNVNEIAEYHAPSMRLFIINKETLAIKRDWDGIELTQAIIIAETRKAPLSIIND